MHHGTLKNGPVWLVERATPPLKAAKPNKPELFMMACLAGLGVPWVGPFSTSL
jgi:hypothetical protein